MRILVIQELTTVSHSTARSFNIEEDINKMTPNLSIANMIAWSVLVNEGSKKDTVADLLGSGYFALSKTETFKAMDVYIGYLNKDDFPYIDLLIFENQVAKEVAELRFGGDNGENTLPKAREVIVIQDGGDVASEIYRRTVISNFGA